MGRKTRLPTPGLSHQMIVLMLALLAGVAMLAYEALGDEEKPTGKIAIDVKGLENDDGQVLLYLFKTKKGFPKPTMAIEKVKVSIEDGKATGAFEDIPHGTYAVSAIHDENGNGKLDTKILGIPAEGVGMSNNATSKMGPPKFDDAKFVLNGEKKKLVIKIRYL